MKKKIQVYVENEYYDYAVNIAAAAAAVVVVAVVAVVVAVVVF
jgi:hypothetical protein